MRWDKRTEQGYNKIKIHDNLNISVILYILKKTVKSVKLTNQTVWYIYLPVNKGLEERHKGSMETDKTDYYQCTPAFILRMYIYT